MSDHTIGSLQTGGVPQEMTAWEHHLRQLSARAIRLQVEREAREQERMLDEAELRRRCAVKAADQSPLHALVDVAVKRTPLWQRLLNW